jgi:hypothetical protein
MGGSRQSSSSPVRGKSWSSYRPLHGARSMCGSLSGSPGQITRLVRTSRPWRSARPPNPASFCAALRRIDGVRSHQGIGIAPSAGIVMNAVGQYSARSAGGRGQ